MLVAKEMNISKTGQKKYIYRYVVFEHLNNSFVAVSDLLSTVTYGIHCFFRGEEMLCLCLFCDLCIVLYSFMSLGNVVMWLYPTVRACSCFLFWRCSRVFRDDRTQVINVFKSYIAIHVFRVYCVYYLLIRPVS